MPSNVARTIREMYDRLWDAYGPQHWWPGDTPTEVVVGAILTQNTAWSNVERAIQNLKQAKCLMWKALHDVPSETLAELVRPSGTYRIKTARLKAFVHCLWGHHGGELEDMLGGDLDVARQRLLAVKGIGPETADAILLYAGGRLTFVVDAYTKRILRRHHLIDAEADYESVRDALQRSIEPDVAIYNEFHALLVAAGKQHCGVRARCDECPLADMPHDPQR